MIVSAQPVIKLVDVKIGRRFRKNYGDLSSLMASIEAVGLIHPIVVTPDRKLIAGRRRLEAFKKLGRKTIPALTLDLDAIILGERDENIERMDFAPSEKVAIAEAVEARERKEAKKRQGTRTDLQPSPKFGESKHERETSRRTAKTVGLSGPTYERAKAVVEAAKADPDNYYYLVEDMDRTRRVNGVFKKLQVAKQSEAIEAEPPPLPKGPFRVIVADPPWTYDARATDASHRASNPYPSMDLEAIKDFFPHSMAYKDSALWLWATNAHLRVAFDVMEAWGFTYKTLLTWDKVNMGTGDWLRGQTEHCLLGVRGKPTFRLTNETTIIRSPRGKHSEKPDAFYELVDRLCPGSKVELFQRNPREGFVGTGLEANGATDGTRRFRGGRV